MNKKRKGLLICAGILAAALIALLVLRTGKKAVIQTGNLLENGDFSLLDDQGLPQGWYTDDYIKTPGYTDYMVSDGIAMIVNHERNDARFAQSVSVEPDSLYCFSGEIRAEAQGGLGANLSVADIYVFSECVYDTEGQWQSVRLYGRTGKNQRQVTLFARLGGYSGEATGTAYFRNLSLEQVGSVPADDYAANWYQERTSAADKETGSGKPAWPWLLVIACCYALVCLGLRRAVLGGAGEAAFRARGWLAAAFMLLAAAAARVLIALLIPGYGVDIGCFTNWGSLMADTGAANFYQSAGFCDYPPGYLLVLGLMGRIGSLLGTGMTELMVKLPSIICDIAAAAVLYAFCRKRVSHGAALTVAALYAFNPVPFVAGAAWGQADSVMTLFLLLVVVLAIDHHWAAALPLYMAAALMKPQALMFGPLGLLALGYVLIKNKNKKLYIQAGVGLALAAVVGAAIILPFSPQMDNSEGWWIIQLYRNTMGYYANVTVNACNLYFLFGKNWVDVIADSPWYIRLIAMLALFGGVLAVGLRARWFRRGKLRLYALCAAAAAVVVISLVPMPYSALGTVVIVFSVLLSACLYMAGGEIRHLPLLGALLLLLLCNLGVMMHERYLFPAVALLALACVLERDRRVYALFIAVSVLVFLNVGVVLDRGIRIGGVEGHLSAPLFGINSDSAALEYIVSAGNCLASCFAGLVSASICAEGERVLVSADRAAQEEALPENKNIPALRELLDPQPAARMGAWDWLLMLGLTAVYAVLAFTNLGATKSPQTWWRSASSQDSVVLDLGESHAVNMLYLGGIHRAGQEFIVRVSDDGESWSEPYWAEITEGDCFKWKYVAGSSYYDGQHNYSTTPEMLFGRYVRIEAQSIGTTLYEVILRDPETQAVYPVTLVSGDGANLIDEQDAFFGEPGWYNSTYFDEIYHARTGYEHYLALRGDYTYMPYETSHPPLGNVLIAFSISIFGMTPFGWRFAGALAGVLMLPGMYLLGKLLTKRRLMAFAAMFLMAVDFMHFTQTRIATIDSFVVLFILWSYVFMVYYLRMDYWNKKLWQTLVPLFLSGLFMGLAVASKWTGCYAGVGLALLFFWSLYRRYTQSLEARTLAMEGRAAAAAKEIYRRPTVTLLCCLVFFVAVPLGIYYVSYIPYFLPYTPPGVTVKRVIQAAVGDYFDSGFMGGMLGYHSTPGLGMDHPFYSPWYEWPIMKKPMWYYSGTYRTAGASQTIVAFGNPLVWWGGLAAMAAMALVWLLRHVSRRAGITLHTPQNDMRPAILLISFAAQFVPWMLVPRGTYIYHYFPSIPFIILASALCLDLLADALAEPISIGDRFTLRLRRAPVVLTIACLVAALGLFIAFFPYISGITAANSWLRAMQWFRGWIYY